MPVLKPSEPGRPIMVFIAGSFRPPNHRQWQMISYYSDLVKFSSDNEVVVVVSNPRKESSQHRMGDGRPVTTEDAVEILEIFKNSESRNNVMITDSDDPSPVRTVYGIVEDPEAISDCDVLIGCYRDEADFKKWDRLQERAAASNPSVTILDYRKFAYRRNYGNYAHEVSKLQRGIGGVTLSNAEDVLPSFLSSSEKEAVLKIINKE